RLSSLHDFGDQLAKLAALAASRVSAGLQLLECDRLATAEAGEHLTMLLGVLDADHEVAGVKARLTGHGRAWLAALSDQPRHVPLARRKPEQILGQGNAGLARRDLNDFLRISGAGG